MFRLSAIKPDGRRLWLYSHTPLTAMEGVAAPVPDPERVEVRSHLRWHPVAAEWVIYAAHRQNRTFLPPADHDPLAPEADPQRPTELPPGPYEVAVFQNRFPSLAHESGPVPNIPGVETAPAFGECEVIVFTQDAGTSLGALGTDRIALILEVLGERTADMAKAGIRYVLPFENRGVEMGVTLHHPHGQIYGYGFVPEKQQRALAAMRKQGMVGGRNMISAMAARERDADVRVVAARERALAFVPAFAQFPYETWVVPQSPAAHLGALTTDDRDGVAAALAETLRRLDGLFGKPMPYLMTVNQAPTDGGAYPEWTLWIAIQPIRRAPDKLKYLAGTELGAGVFASDVLPEAAAAALRKVAL